MQALNKKVPMGQQVWNHKLWTCADADFNGHHPAVYINQHLIQCGLFSHKGMYNNHILYYKDAISIAISNYYTSLIRSGDGNNKPLFSLINSTLWPPFTLNPRLYSTDFCNSVMSFFIDNIDKIHQQLTTTTSPSFLKKFLKNLNTI